MWILPRIEPTAAQAIYTAEFPFTHHRITLSVHRARVPRAKKHSWFSLETVESIPVPSPHRLALDQLLVCSTLPAS